MSVAALWLPIVASAVFVFIASSIIHMATPLHRNDLKTVPHEDEVLDALRRLNIPAGDYVAPRPSSMAAMKDPQFIDKVKKGPLLLMTVAHDGSVSMTKNLALWFVYTIVVGILTADVAGAAFMRGADYYDVCNLVARVAFMGYFLALLQNSIWNRRSWLTTFKSMIDGAIYAFITGETFAWLWPR
jgi:hypothetical protein